MPSATSSLPAWAPDVYSRAVDAQSTVRRFARWLEHERSAVHALDRPLRQQALTEWGNQRRSLALDTSTLWPIQCVVRLSRISRGRAVPSVGKGLEHSSRRVADDVSQERLKKVAELRPVRCRVVLTADRGFADTHLMDYLARWGWHWRSRINGSVGSYHDGKRGCHMHRIAFSAGQALFWHQVSITEKRDGPVHVVWGRPQASKAQGLVVSDEPTEATTCEEDGLRFDIEENFWDDTSHGFQLESSLIRSANA